MLAPQLELSSGEDRYQREPTHGETPERIFDRRWALSMLDRADAVADHAPSCRLTCREILADDLSQVEERQTAIRRANASNASRLLAQFLGRHTSIPADFAVVRGRCVMHYPSVRHSLHKDAQLH
jgi:hypothetical protein